MVQVEVQNQLAEHIAQQKKQLTFLANGPLLHIASNNLQCTLAAVRPP